jgi:4-hydroxy-tetrahydrodipicolinate synthase
MEVNFVESNPGPVKAAMAEMGLLEPVWRLPLVAPKTESLSRIRAVLESRDLLPADGPNRREVLPQERTHAAVAH